MPANTSPIFGLTPNVGLTQYGTAEATTRSGPPTAKSTFFTAGASGSRVDLITFTASVTTSAGLWRVWIYTGSTYYMIHEEPVSAVTVSATQKAYNAEWRPTVPIILPTGYTLVFTTEVGNTTAVAAFGADF